jgi:hypothetical protein
MTDDNRTPDHGRSRWRPVPIVMLIVVVGWLAFSVVTFDTTMVISQIAIGTAVLVALFSDDRFRVDGTLRCGRRNAK